MSERTDRIGRIIRAVERCGRKASWRQKPCDCTAEIAAELDAERAEAVEACAKIAELDLQENLAATIRAQGGKT